MLGIPFVSFYQESVVHNPWRHVVIVDAQCPYVLAEDRSESLRVARQVGSAWEVKNVLLKKGWQRLREPALVDKERARTEMFEVLYSVSMGLGTRFHNTYHFRLAESSALTMKRTSNDDLAIFLASVCKFIDFIAQFTRQLVEEAGAVSRGDRRIEGD